MPRSNSITIQLSSSNGLREEYVSFLLTFDSLEIQVIVSSFCAFYWVASSFFYKQLQCTYKRSGGLILHFLETDWLDCWRATFRSHWAYSGANPSQDGDGKMALESRETSLQYFGGWRGLINCKLLPIYTIKIHFKKWIGWRNHWNYFISHSIVIVISCRN